MITHEFECEFHGRFTARVKAGSVPRCPSGCSKSFVQLVFVQPPGFVGARTKRADKALREAADLQGLSDISTSPSRPGGTVAERNRLRGPKGAPALQYPQFAAAQAGPGALKKFLSAMTAPGNALSEVGLGHGYNPAEWQRDKKSGVVKHVGARTAIEERPAASVDRVRE